MIPWDINMVSLITARQFRVFRQPLLLDILTHVIHNSHTFNVLLYISRCAFYKTHSRDNLISALQCISHTIHIYKSFHSFCFSSFQKLTIVKCHKIHV
jgi:hypothetical protein